MEANWKILCLTCGAGIAASSFLFFHFFYPYHLFFREQILLFLYSKEYFLSYFNRPAWLSCYTGDFLTQFFYLRGGGPLVLTFLLLLEWFLCSKIIRIITKSIRSCLWALLPTGVDFTLYCHLLHPVSVSVALILSFVLFIACHAIENRKLALTTGIALIFLAYWLAGSALFVLVSLIVANDWMNGRQKLFKPVSFIFLALLVPYLFSKLYLVTIPQAYLFPATLSVSILLIPAVLITLIMAVIVKRLPQRHVPFVMTGIPLMFLIILGGGIGSYGNFKFEKILSLDSETYFGNTGRVLHLSRKYQLKNRLSAYYINIALSRLGQLPDHFPEFYQPATQGLFLPVVPSESWQNILFSSEAYYLTGDLNMAQHSAMLGMTFSPNLRSSRMVKRLAEINLVAHDYRAAAKYLRLLEKTLFHKKWATDRIKLIQTGEEPAWLSAKRNQIAKTDSLRKSNDYLQSLNFLLDQTEGNRIALDYLLCYHLLNKDLNSFQKIYHQHERLIRRPLPSSYSEALLILLFKSGASREKVNEYGIPAEKVSSFISYSNEYEKAKGNLKQIPTNYNHSYWYYYHFATFRKNKN